MKKTFVDSKVLITAACGDKKDPMTIRALEVLDDPERYFISTIYVSMEVLPKATYFQRQEEIDFYNKYFAAVHE